MQLYVIYGDCGGLYANYEWDNLWGPRLIRIRGGGIVEPEDRGKGCGRQKLAWKAASLVQEPSFFVVVLFPFMMREKGAI